MKTDEIGRFGKYAVEETYTWESLRRDFLPGGRAKRDEGAASPAAAAEVAGPRAANNARPVTNIG